MMCGQPEQFLIPPSIGIPGVCHPVHMCTHTTCTHTYTHMLTYHAYPLEGISGTVMAYVDDITGTKFNTPDDVLVNSPGTLLVPVTCKNYLR